MMMANLNRKTWNKFKLLVPFMTVVFFTACQNIAMTETPIAPLLAAPPTLTPFPSITPSPIPISFFLTQTARVIEDETLTVAASLPLTETSTPTFENTNEVTLSLVQRIETGIPHFARVIVDEGHLYAYSGEYRDLWVYSLLDPETPIGIFSFPLQVLRTPPYFEFDIENYTLYIRGSICSEEGLCWYTLDTENGEFVLSNQIATDEINGRIVAILAAENRAYLIVNGTHRERIESIQAIDPDEGIISKVDYASRNSENGEWVSAFEYAAEHLYLIRTESKPYAHERKYFLDILKTSDTNLELINSIEISDVPDMRTGNFTMALNDGFAYITIWSSNGAYDYSMGDETLGELLVLDVGNPTQIELMSRQRLYDSVRDSLVYGDNIYFSIHKGVMAYNISNPNAPYVSGKIALNSAYWGMGSLANHDNILYVSTSAGELYAIEIHE